jgi:hypothetical protein
MARLQLSLLQRIKMTALLKNHFDLRLILGKVSKKSLAEERFGCPKKLSL